jgi:hypothetical protein
MSSDDLTKKISEGEEKITQPMISDLFRLVEELKQSTEARFDAMQQYMDRRFDAMSDEMRSGFAKLEDMIDRDRLHAEADYHDLLRIRHIETKAS